MTTATFKLSSPLKTHDGVVNELNLRTPKARLIVKHGDPFTIRPVKNDKGETESHEYVYDNKSMLQFAADMTGVDDLILSDLSVSDFMRLRGAITNIILELVPDKNPSEQPGI
ncbi:hypothetical protein [Bradyrhizobium neotropicale]|uniref:Phage tail assembly protein n=1 Tax=Bradyrhizobium neotropicale TaxID=1497615 RepID=A0A176Z3V3_9BRAD|nr:hypothetical protein [Bradyrhizobium neotropicale]OAF14123.1 hypothetical protein AXW67_00570 [Bradyrhizobium neotropicale]